MNPSVPAAAGSHMTVTVLKHGPWFKADILRLAHEGGEAILKDFSGKSRLMRWWGRRQLLRERRALARLQGIPGVPVDLGEVPPCGLLLEPMPGEAITRWRRRSPDETAPLIARLRTLVERIHERGVAHLDLRKRDNILVGPDGTPSIIDFNASLCFVPGSLGARLLFPILRRIDQAAVLKWKAYLAPAQLTPSERRRHGRMGLLRRLWFFN